MLHCVHVHRNRTQSHFIVYMEILPFYCHVFIMLVLYFCSIYYIVPGRYHADTEEKPCSIKWALDKIELLNCLLSTNWIWFVNIKWAKLHQPKKEKKKEYAFQPTVKWMNGYRLYSGGEDKSTSHDLLAIDMLPSFDYIILWPKDWKPLSISQSPLHQSTPLWDACNLIYFGGVRLRQP